MLKNLQDCLGICPIGKIMDYYLWKFEYAIENVRLGQ